MLQPTLDEIEAVGAQGGVMTGVPTGFTDLDRLLNGLHPGQLIIVAGRPGLGKALALDTPLPTPDGWTTMGEVEVGDRLLAADGTPTTVTAAFDVMDGRPCYEVEFSDGSVIVADADHLWQTTHARVLEPAQAGGPVGQAGSGAQARREGVVTTAEIAATLRTGPDARLNHTVTNCAPLRLPARRLPVPPYNLGVRLGDGGADPSASPGPSARPSGRSVSARNGTSPGLPAGFRGAAPGAARRSVRRRRHGRPHRQPPVHLDLAAAGRRRPGTRGEPRLPLHGHREAGARPYRAVVDGLHGHLRHRRTSSSGKSASAPPTPPRRRTASGRVRYVVDVRPVASVPVRCVTVDNADHLYLAGRSMIPTHNSTASMDFARNAAIRANQAAAIFSLEMSKVEIVMRLLSAEARVPLHVLRSGQLSDDDWTKLARCMGEISEAPLFVDDTPEHEPDGDPGQGPPAQAAARPQDDRRRLSPADDLAEAHREPPAGGRGPVPWPQAAGQGGRVPGDRGQSAEPWPRAAHRQAPAAVRSAGIRLPDGGDPVDRADSNTEVTHRSSCSPAATRDIPVWALDENLRYSPRHHDPRLPQRAAGGLPADACLRASRSTRRRTIRS